MLTIGTCVKIVAVSLLAVAVQHVARFMVHIGIFAHYYQHYPGPCKRIDNMQLGSEDFHTLPNGLTFITSGFRLQKMSAGVDEHFRRHGIQGRIYLLDLNKVESGVKHLRIAPSERFNPDTFAPHGISVWEDKKAGRHVLFVVNHALEEPAADRVEKFTFDPERQELVHQAYYHSGEAMKTLNDVQALGENSFYATNYQYFRNQAAQLAETFLLLSLTDVIYFDGQKYASVAEGMISPNGIAMSNDGHVSDVLALSSSQFYLSNLFSGQSRAGQLLEMVALMPWSSVVLCEHSLCQTAVAGLLGACGLALSDGTGDRQYVYVAPCLAHEIRVFRRNVDNSLTLQQIFPLNGFPDNIQVDAVTGDLYVGCHAIGHKIMLSLEDPGKHVAPSQVLHLSVTDGNITAASELFYDHGHLISGAATALVYKKKLLIGSILDSLVICDVNVPV